MARTIKPGDQVAWQTSQGETTGVVEKKLTAPARVKGHVAKPDAAHPEYLVRSDKSGKQAIHAPGALRKK